MESAWCTFIRSSSRRTRGGGVLRGELRLGLVDQSLADAGNSNIVLIEHLALAGVRRHVHQHFAILLQHVPVPRFERCAVKKAPDLTCEPRGLAHAPEEHEAVALVHARSEAEDADLATVPGGTGIEHI